MALRQSAAVLLEGKKKCWLPDEILEMSLAQQ
jgi:hypothetical protein